MCCEIKILAIQKKKSLIQRSNIMTLYTVGFTKKTAQDFFEMLIVNNIKKLIDIRLNNKSQLAGFAKSVDLEYFLKKIVNIEYTHMPQFAPTKQLLKSYQKKEISWEEYQKQYKDILNKRNVLKSIDYSIFNNAVLLCSEVTADKCHRRLLAEYLSKNNNEIEIVHL